MMIRRLHSAGARLACALVVLASCAPEAPRTPRDAGARFFAVLDALGVRQAPSASAVEALRPFVSRDLGDAFELVSRTPAAVAADSGAWFGSLPEGYTSADPRQVIPRGDTTLVVVAMANTMEKPSVSWTDTLVVVTEQGRFVVADMRYGAGWDFARHGSLRSLLRSRAGAVSPNP